MADPLAEEIGRTLIGRNERLAVVETSAGGCLASSFFSVVGASAWIRAALVPYDRVSQEALLGVTVESTVSEAAAIALATAARARLHVEWAIAETGIAGPQTGRRSTKPAGLTWLAISGPTGTTTRQVLVEDGGRAANMQAFAAAGLTFLLETLRTA